MMIENLMRFIVRSLLLCSFARRCASHAVLCIYIPHRKTYFVDNKRVSLRERAGKGSFNYYIPIYIEK